MKTINALDPDIRIDYRTHPGFFNVTPSGITEADEEIFYSLFKEADEICSLLSNGANALSNKLINSSCERLMLPIFNEISRLCSNLISDRNLLKPVFPEIIQKTFEALVSEVQFKNNAKNSSKSIIDCSLTRDTCRDMSTKGVSTRLLPPEYIQALWELTTPFREKNLEMRKTTHPTKVCSNPLPLEGPYWEVTSQILKAVGFMDGLAMYYGHQMVPMYCTLVHSYPGEEWFRGCYDDVGMKTADCAYMHYDHSDDVPKALMYISNVTDKNGPFCVVPGSNGWHKSHVQGLFFKFLDQVGGPLARKNTPQHDVYHRPLLKDKTFRGEFFKLPRAFQGSSHFGDDVVDNTSLSKFLLSRELRLTSDIANCMLFSGHTTIHRGGIVDEGERWVFQLGFRKSD